MIRSRSGPSTWPPAPRRNSARRSGSSPSRPVPCLAGRGPPRVREENTLEAVLARPRQRWHYEPRSDLATLAAAYGWGLVTSHPYRDGNKRIAFLAMAIFLGLNGYEIESTQEEVVTLMFAAAAGQRTEAELAEWV